MKVCPSCGTHAALDAQWCLKCGHQFRTKFDEVGKPRTPAEQTQQATGATQQQGTMTGMPLANPTRLGLPPSVHQPQTQQPQMGYPATIVPPIAPPVVRRRFKPIWLAAIVPGVLLLGYVGFKQTTRGKLVGPIWLSESYGQAYEFHINGTMIDYRLNGGMVGGLTEADTSADAPGYGSMRYSKYPAHWSLDGNTIQVEYDEGHGIMGGGTHLIASLSGSMLVFSNEEPLVPVSSLPTKPPKEEWDVFDMNGNRVKGPERDKMIKDLDQIQKADRR